MIADDWNVTRVALQVLTEERLGRKMRQALGSEDAQYAAAKRALGG